MYYVLHGTTNALAKEGSTESRTNQSRSSGRSGEVQDFTSSNHPTLFTNIGSTLYRFPPVSSLFFCFYLLSLPEENNVTSTT
jgi:hypothetical protein